MICQMGSTEWVSGKIPQKRKLIYAWLLMKYCLCEVDSLGRWSLDCHRIVTNCRASIVYFKWKKRRANVFHHLSSTFWPLSLSVWHVRHRFSSPRAAPRSRGGVEASALCEWGGVMSRFRAILVRMVLFTETPNMFKDCAKDMFVASRMFFL